MAILNDSEKPTIDEALAHFGVMGMRWGQNKKGDQPSAPSNRQLNKESKARDKIARDKEIDAARERYANSSRNNYLKAKAQYKVDKKTIGTREARKKFDEVKQKNIDDFELAKQAKSGKETTIAVLAIVGGVALSALAGAAQHR